MNGKPSRRNFLGASTGFAAAGFAALPIPLLPPRNRSA